MNCGNEWVCCVRVFAKRHKHILTFIHRETGFNQNKKKTSLTLTRRGNVAETEHRKKKTSIEMVLCKCKMVLVFLLIFQNVSTYNILITFYLMRAYGKWWTKCPTFPYIEKHNKFQWPRLPTLTNHSNGKHVLLHIAHIFQFFFTFRMDTGHQSVCHRISKTWDLNIFSKQFKETDIFLIFQIKSGE